MPVVSVKTPVPETSSESLIKAPYTVSVLESSTLMVVPLISAMVVALAAVPSTTLPDPAMLSTPVPAPAIEFEIVSVWPAPGASVTLFEAANRPAPALVPFVPGMMPAPPLPP